MCFVEEDFQVLLPLLTSEAGILPLYQFLVVVSSGSKMGRQLHQNKSWYGPICTREEAHGRVDDRLPILVRELLSSLSRK